MQVPCHVCQYPISNTQLMNLNQNNEIDCQLFFKHGLTPIQMRCGDIFHAKCVAQYKSTICPQCKKLYSNRVVNIPKDNQNEDEQTLINNFSFLRLYNKEPELYNKKPEI